VKLGAKVGFSVGREVGAAVGLNIANDFFSAEVTAILDCRSTI
jgi:hypothetical protein